MIDIIWKGWLHTLATVACCEQSVNNTHIRFTGDLETWSLAESRCLYIRLDKISLLS